MFWNDLVLGGKQNLPPSCLCYPKDPMWNELNLRQKADSAEVLDKGLTTNIFKIYFFSMVLRHIGSR